MQIYPGPNRGLAPSGGTYPPQLKYGVVGIPGEGQWFPGIFWLFGSFFTDFNLERLG